nr:hypothetical protein [Tanacetum cinerariifolium]
MHIWAQAQHEKAYELPLSLEISWLRPESFKMHAGTLSRRRDLKKRLGSRQVRSMTESPEPRRGRSESPRKKDSERRTVFERLKKVAVETPKAATRVLVQGKQSLLLKNIITKEHPHEEWNLCQKVKIVQEDTESQNPSSRSRALRTIYPNRGKAVTFNQRTKAKQRERPGESSKEGGNLKKGQAAGNPDGTAMAESSQTKDYPNFLSEDGDLIPPRGGGWDGGSYDYRS